MMKPLNRISKLLALVAVGCSSLPAATELFREGPVVRLNNGLLTTTFNVANGNWEALYPDGTIFATDLQCRVEADTSSTSKRGPPIFSFAKVRQPLGPGIRVDIERGTEPPFTLTLTMFDDQPFFLAQVKVARPNNWKLREAVLGEGKYYMGGDLRQASALIHDWDGGWRDEIQRVEPAGQGARWETSSQYFFCGHNGADHRSVILGALSAEAPCRIEAWTALDQDPRALFLRCRCNYTLNPLAAENETWKSPALMISAPAKVFHGLEACGAAVQAFRLESEAGTESAPGIWGRAVAGGASGESRISTSATAEHKSTESEVVRMTRLEQLFPTLKKWARRYFADPSFWGGDTARPLVDLPAEEPNRMWTSLGALFGGGMMFSNTIPPAGSPAQILMPKAPAAAGNLVRPVDLFERPPGWSPKLPRIWVHKARPSDAATWDAVGLFNWTVEAAHEQNGWHGETQKITLDFTRHLEFGPSRRCLVYDVWQRRYLGAFSNQIDWLLPPATCRVLNVQPEADYPQILGVHGPMSNSVESLKRVAWDRGTRILTAWIQTLKSMPCAFALHLPENFGLVRATANGQPVDVESQSPYCAMVRFNSGETGRVKCGMEFNHLVKAPEALIVGEREVLARQPVVEENGSIALYKLSPLWTDQSYDLDGAPLGNGIRPNIGGRAPFWIFWDVSPYSGAYKKLVAEGINEGDGKVSFEVLGDGKTLYDSGPVEKGGRAKIEINIGGTRELTLVAHSLEDRFVRTRGCFEHPWLAR